MECSDQSTVRVFRQKLTLEDAIGSHGARFKRVTNGIPLASIVSYRYHCKFRPNTEGRPSHPHLTMNTCHHADDATTLKDDPVIQSNVAQTLVYVPVALSVGAGLARCMVEEHARCFTAREQHLQYTSGGWFQPVTQLLTLQPYP
jgi:hypothetical protein